MIDIYWADETRTRIDIKLKRGWNWNDLRQSVDTADTMIGSVEHTVNLLIDIRDAGGLPTDFLQVAGDLLGGGDPRPNQGETLILGANWMLKTAYQALDIENGLSGGAAPVRCRNAETPAALY